MTAPRLLLPLQYLTLQVPGQDRQEPFRFSHRAPMNGCGYETWEWMTA